jgi:hypothetical protein
VNYSLNSEHVLGEVLSDVVPLARKATSCAEILFELGAPRDSWYFRKLAYTAWLFGIELPLSL